MAMVVMPKAVAMAKTMSVAVTMAVAMTAGESLARDRQGSRCKRESADGGRDDLLDANHGGLPLSAGREFALRCSTLAARIALRCDQRHPAGATRHPLRDAVMTYV
jgi:hypothetical protein